MLSAKLLLSILFIFIFSSCQQGENLLNIKRQPILILGQVTPLSAAMALQKSLWLDPFRSHAAGCSAQARLYELGTNGQKIGSAISVANLDSTARFQLKIDPIKLKNEYVEYMIEVQGSGGGICDNVFMRPVIGDINQQTVDWASTLISMTGLADLPKKLPQNKSQDVSQFISDLDNTNLNAAYTMLTTNIDKRDQFIDMFGDVPEKLFVSAPTLRSLDIPVLLNENQVYTYDVDAYHWTGTYDVLVEWKVNGVTVHSGAPGDAYIFSPDKKMSGSYELEVIIGKDNGSSLIDSTVPLLSYEYTIIVNNTFPATPPSFTLPEVATINSTVLATIATGAALVNCDSFDNFKFFVNQSTTPALNLINETCSGDPTQDVLLNLTPGLNSIRLWVKDLPDLLGQSSIQTIYYDVTDPIVSLTLSNSVLKGGDTINIALGASDDDQLSSLKLYYSDDNGVNYSDIVNLNVSATTYNWTVPNDNTNLGKLKLEAIDRAGRISLAEVAISIDSIAPVAPVASLYSASVTNNRNIKVTISNCLDYSQIIVQESNSTPSLSHLTWISCSTSVGAIDYELSDSDGAKQLYLFARDLAGNISASSAALNVTLDRVAPSAPSIEFYPTVGFKTDSVNFTLATCSDTSHVYVSNSSVTPSLNAPEWQGCNTTIGGYSHTLSNSADGNYSIYLWAKDSAGNLSSGTTSSTYIDNTLPIITSFVLNDGEQYSPTVFSPFNLLATDNQAVTHMKVVYSSNGQCVYNDYLAEEWRSYSALDSVQLTFGDGLKKVCAWVKDGAGNISQMSNLPNGTNGTDTDQISFEIGNPPIITSFNVKNAVSNELNYSAGQNLELNWTVEDVEGLRPNPLVIYYTTDGVEWSELNGITQSPTPGTNYSGSHLVTNTNTVNYVRFKLVAKDISGNTSVPAVTEYLNTGNWSVYLGTKDIGDGGSGNAFQLKASGASGEYYATNPITGDVYFLSHNEGLFKFSIKTGIVSNILRVSSVTAEFIRPGENIYTSNVKMWNEAKIAFDLNGFLYVSIAQVGIIGSKILKINLDTGDITDYLGGGNVINESATKETVNVYRSHFIFDKDNTLYFLASCQSDGSHSSTNAAHSIRLMKATQNSVSKEIAVVSPVAGNCVRSSVVSNGQSAMTQPLTVSAWPGLMSFGQLPNNNLLVCFYGNQCRKIIDGKMYTSNLETYGVYCGGDSNQCYISNGGAGHESRALYRSSINLSGTGGDTLDELIASSQGTGADCTDDGVDKNSSCIISRFAPIRGPGNIVLFNDGQDTSNSGKSLRLRFVDDQNKLRTLVGSLPLFGEGLNRTKVRSNINGIYYKKISDPVTVFTEGLYFSDGSAMVVGKVEADNTVSIIAGRQGGGAHPGDGKRFEKGQTLGSSYNNLNLGVFSFGPDGYPWMRIFGDIYTVDSSLNLYRKTNASTSSAGNYYHLLTHDELIGTRSLFVGGGGSNLTVDGNNGVILFGGYYYLPTYTTPNVNLLRFNFTTGRADHLMGNANLTGVTTDTAGEVAAADLRSMSFGDCKNGGSYIDCFTRYRSDNDRIYFGEGNKLRFITNITANTANRELATVFSTVGGETIRNFIFSLDNSKVFYIDDTGYLRCSLTPSAPHAWCNGSVLGPINGMNTIVSQNDQLTWKDENTLLISNGRGEVLQFSAPLIPVISLHTPTPTNSRDVSLTMSSCSNATKVIVKESNSIPTIGDSQWVDCSTTAGAINYELSNSDGVKSLYVFAQYPGNIISEASSVLNVTLDRTPPNSPTISFYPTNGFKNSNSSFTISSCSDTSHVYVSNSSVTPSLNAPEWQACNTTQGAYSHVLSNSVDGDYPVFIWTKDSAGNISSMTTSVTYIDNIAPVISSFVLNDGDEYAGTMFANFEIDASDNKEVIHMRVVNSLNSDCDFADDHWEVLNQNGGIQLTFGDGVKKVCAWVKDGAGNISVISAAPTGTLGVDTDTIKFEVGNVPFITNFTVRNITPGLKFHTKEYDPGDQLELIWNIEDQEGLKLSPVSIEYTIDGNIYLPLTGFSQSCIAGLLNCNESLVLTDSSTIAYKRFRLTARDLAGNISIAAFSEYLNVGQWSVYAGTRDVGINGTATSFDFKGLTNNQQIFATHPVTNDIYFLSNSQGFFKLDIRTGIVSRLIEHGSPSVNMVHGGNIYNSNVRLNTAGGIATIAFDSNGLLYMQLSETRRIVKIDVDSGLIQNYVGGGNVSDATATVSTVNILSGSTFIFDKDNNLYFMASCQATGAYDAGNAAHAVRLMKAAQNPATKAASSVEPFAGNCTRGNLSTQGDHRLNQPFSYRNWVTRTQFTLAPLPDGSNAILYCTLDSGGPCYKILDDKIYSFSISLTSIYFDHVTQKFYGSVNKRIVEVNIELTPPYTANSLGSSVVTSSNPSASCGEDGVDPLTACTSTMMAFGRGPAGIMLFNDGHSVDAANGMRLRYIDGENKVRTLLGARSFFGEYLDKKYIRSEIRGIYYLRPDQALNPAAFDSRLYFVDHSALVMAKVRNDDTVEIVAGNQTPGTSTAPVNGSNFDKTIGLGNPYLNYAMAAFEFGPDGLPWMRMWGHAYKVGSDLKLIQKTTGSLTGLYANYWHTAAHGATINHNMQTYGYGGSSNLTITGTNSFILLGGLNTAAPFIDPGATMMKFDFTPNVFDKLMGDITISGVVADTGGPVPAADLRASSFWTHCRALSCFTRYDSTDDRVYFSEASQIRYVSNVNIGTANRELKTVFTAQSGGTINNFILSLDRTKIFYISGGKLFCAEMTPSGHAWCNESDLGPDTAMQTILPGTSQMTWKDASTLLISNYRGEILQFILPAE